MIRLSIELIDDLMRFQFCKTVTLISVILVLVLAYPLHAWASAEVLQAVTASGIIAFVNILLACFTLEYAFDKSNRVFMTAVFGGMGIRMGLILATVTILLLNGYHALALTLSLMGFYVIFMIVEIIYAMRAMSQRKPARSPRKTYGRGHSLRALPVEQRSN